MGEPVWCTPLAHNPAWARAWSARWVGHALAGAWICPGHDAGLNLRTPGGLVWPEIPSVGWRGFCGGGSTRQLDGRCLWRGQHVGRDQAAPIGRGPGWRHCKGAVEGVRAPDQAAAGDRAAPAGRQTAAGGCGVPVDNRVAACNQVAAARDQVVATCG